MTAQASGPIVVTNQGIELAMSVSGTGPDLLFVHGLGSAQLLWSPLIASLRDRYRCWSLDLRGHGGSGRAPEDRYRLVDYASDVEAAIGHIGQPTIGIGHSLGGISLVRAAAGGQRDLRALYVLDSAILRRPDQASSSVAIFEKQLAMVRSFQAEDRPVGDYQRVLGQTMNPMGDINENLMVPEQLRGRAESLSQMDPACMAAVVEGRTGDSFVAPAVDVPLRVIAADPAMGASFKPEHVDELRTLSPQAHVETLIGVGHALMMMRGFDEIIRNDLATWLEALD